MGCIVTVRTWFAYLVRPASRNHTRATWQSRYIRPLYLEYTPTIVTHRLYRAVSLRGGTAPRLKPHKPPSTKLRTTTNRDGWDRCEGASFAEGNACSPLPSPYPTDGEVGDDTTAPSGGRGFEGGQSLLSRS